ncbi:MAG TPA: response regulator [Methylomirabilota bacterium]|jgi:two-component system response regulator (stage 0 sporulation protein F)|nr:response regulator [Methylomirabilota bacterium]
MTGSLGRILIVDDEQPVLDVLSEYFATQGYTVETASNGADALATVRRARPDLVLLDVRMPGMDGVEVLRRLRAADESLAVIMVTATEDVALARETLKIGAFDYVAKPFDFGYLDRAVAAGLLPAVSLEGLDGAPGEASDDPWKGLILTVFRAVREMSPASRASTGDRLETAALAAAGEARAARGAAAVQHLGQIALLSSVAAELGDLPSAARSSIEAALGVAHKSVAPS